jgi:DNA modification methylase
VANDGNLDWTAAYDLFAGDVAYVWHASFFTIDVGQNLRAAQFEIRASIIWRKQHFAISQGHYHWQHEPCWYCVRRGRSARWGGDRTQSTIWDISSLNAAGRQEERVAHGTQKPVECMARPMRNHGGLGDIVYDPFLGSGTTIVAAEQTGRLCRGLELAPKYIAVTLQRLADMGLEPRRVGA